MVLDDVMRQGSLACWDQRLTFSLACSSLQPKPFDSVYMLCKTKITQRDKRLAGWRKANPKERSDQGKKNRSPILKARLKERFTKWQLINKIIIVKKVIYSFLAPLACRMKSIKGKSSRMTTSLIVLRLPKPSTIVKPSRNSPVNKLHDMLTQPSRQKTQLVSVSFFCYF